MLLLLSLLLLFSVFVVVVVGLGGASYRSRCEQAMRVPGAESPCWQIPVQLLLRLNTCFSMACLKPLAASRWSLVASHWLLMASHWLLVASHWLLVASHGLLWWPNTLVAVAVVGSSTHAMHVCAYI